MTGYSENDWVTRVHDSRDTKHYVVIFIFVIFVSRLSCFPASGKKNEAPPNTRDYTVPIKRDCLTISTKKSSALTANICRNKTVQGFVNSGVIVKTINISVGVGELGNKFL